MQCDSAAPISAVSEQGRCDVTRLPSSLQSPSRVGAVQLGCPSLCSLRAGVRYGPATLLPVVSKQDGCSVAQLSSPLQSQLLNKKCRSEEQLHSSNSRPPPVTSSLVSLPKTFRGCQLLEEMWHFKTQFFQAWL